MLLSKKLREIYRKYRKAFRELFGAPLSQFWDSDHGFNLMAFHTQMLDAVDDRLHQELVRRFGIKASRLLDLLMWDCYDVKNDHLFDEAHDIYEYEEEE